MTSKSKPPLKWYKFGVYIDAFCDGRRYLIKETPNGFRIVGPGFARLRTTMRSAKALANEKNRNAPDD